MSTYLFGNQSVSSEDAGFVAALSQAHAERVRPRCLCLNEGLEMYVARLGDGFIVKRMPHTGSLHAPDCASYEAPPDATGLGQVVGTAIQENPHTGEVLLKVGFSMSKVEGRATTPTPGSAGASVTAEGMKLSLRGLLHYLWDQAELTRWQPGFAGKRSWGTVRRHLLAAAENKIARGAALGARLYIPEVFSAEHRDAINARRVAQFAQAVAPPGHPQHLMLLVAEVKEVVPARYGFKAVIKHLPDQAFGLDEQLYRQFGRRFERELALWASAEDVHMVVIATFGVSEAGIPLISEMSLMPVTSQWLPIEDVFERQLLDRLVAEGRSFIKGLRYNMAPGGLFASATLTDVADSAPILVIASPGIGDATVDALLRDFAPTKAPPWLWRAAAEAMPALPSRTTRRLPAA